MKKKFQPKNSPYFSYLDNLQNFKEVCVQQNVFMKSAKSVSKYRYVSKYKKIMYIFSFECFWDYTIIIRKIILIGITFSPP